MRTPLLRLALLLAAAQYAERGAEAACTGVAPVVVCPTVHNDVKAEVDCVNYVLGNPCAAGHTTFMEKNSKWTIVTGVTCDAANNVWTVPEAGAQVPLTIAETIVCAKFAPDTTKKCSVCENVLKTPCTGTNCGGAFTESVDLQGCRELKCAGAEHLELNGNAKKLVATDKITCNGQKKWEYGTEDVTDAVCIKDLPAIDCSPVAGLATDCDKADRVDPASGCVAPSLNTASKQLECTTAGQKLYVPSGTDWKEGVVKCDTGDNKWKLDVPTPTEITKAVCASVNPTVPLAATCPAVRDPCAEPALATPEVGCKPPTFGNNKLTCVLPSPDLYVRTSGSWKKGAVAECVADKWTLDGADTFTEAICAKGNPNIAPKVPCEACGDVDKSTYCTAATGCTEGGPFVPSSTGCKEVTCPTDEFLSINNGDGRADKITCNAENKWKDGVVDVTDAVCVKKLSCMTKNPLKSDCTPFANKLAIGCEPAIPTDDTDFVCPGTKKIFYKKDGAVKWTESAINLIKCDTKTGLWSFDTDKSMKRDDELICAEKNPDEAYGTACGVFTDPDYDCKLDEGCDVGALADTQDPMGKTCGDGEFFVNSEGNWIDTDKIVCNELNTWETNKAAPVAVTGARCVKKFECLKKNPISSEASTCAGLLDPTGCVVVDLTVTPLVCPDPAHNLYVKPAAAGPWELETGKIVCDEKSGVWKRGDDPATALPMAKGDAVVCNTAPPVGKTCPDLHTMGDAAACQGDTSIDQTAAAATCEPISITHDGPIDCANELYFQTDRSVMWMKAAIPFQCDKDANAWKDKSTAIDGVVKKVICVAQNPNHQHPCPPLPTSNCDSIDPNLKCSAVAFPPFAEVNKDNGAAMCLDGKKLYFKPKGKNYFQEWFSIKCLADKTWQLTIPPKPVPGISPEPKTQIAGNEDNFICAKSNPDPAVCTREKKFSSMDDFVFNKEKQTFEAGAKFDCGDNADDLLYEFVSEAHIPLSPEKHLMCSQDGKWKLAGEDYGKVVCGLRKCRMCNAIPKEAQMTPLQGYTTPTIHKGANSHCFPLNCEKLALKLNDDEQFVHYKGTVNCVKMETTPDPNNPRAVLSVNTWTAQVAGATVEVKEAACAQKLYCLSASPTATETAATDPPKLKQVKLDCPTAPGDEVPGCESPTLAGGASGIAHNILKCPAGKLYLIGPLSGPRFDQTEYWEEIAGFKMVETGNGNRGEENTPEPHCDDQYGEWGVRIVDGDKKERRDYRHRIVCGTSNPKKKTTTTTTTTTPAPLVEICALCRDSLPNMPDDFNTTTNLASDNVTGPGQVCVMQVKDKIYEILIGNTQPVDGLMCTREDSSSWFERKCENVKENGTETYVCKQVGTRIAEFKTRLAPKNNDWKPLSYVVLAVVLIAIGGMGIGCVMIFLRMRKDLSEKEKKKERGVTKKYTAANVMKTSGKSSGGRSELGKSKEPTKSKMEENDDAPTLKL